MGQKSRKFIRRTVICLALMAGMTRGAFADEAVFHPEWGSVFVNAGVEGTIILKRVGDTERHVYNPERADEEKTPASIFKIPNALIAYERACPPGEAGLHGGDALCCAGFVAQRGSANKITGQAPFT